MVFAYNIIKRLQGADNDDVLSAYETVGDVPKQPQTQDFDYDRTIHKYNRWSSKEDDIIRKEASGKSDKEIAIQLYRTVGAVRERRLKLNIKRKRIWEH